MKSSTILGGVTLLLASILLQVEQASAGISYNLSNQPTSITNLTIAGHGIFDVAIQYNTSFSDIWGSDPNSPTPEPEFWGDVTGAVLASDAISNALNGVGLYPTLATSIYTPIQPEAQPPGGIWGSAVSYSIDPSYTGPGLFSTGTAVADPTIGWAQYTVVPEPAAFPLTFVALAGFLTLRTIRRQRSKSPS